jgi:signal peptidase I
MTRRLVAWTASTAILIAVLLGVLSATGLRFFTVSSPSMGTVAPVGTLVVAKAAASYAVGDIVTYERSGRSYTHRIVATDPDGSFITKGDLNSAVDALPVTTDLIVGRAVWIAPGLGWLFQALPWLVIGGVAVYLFSLWHRFDHSWQWVVRISGWTLVVTAVAVWLRPWVNLVMLGSGPAESGGGALMHVVNSGLFPLDVLGTRLVSGQDTVAHVTYQDARGYYSLTPTLALYWWQQLWLYLLCLVPTGLAFLIRKPAAAPPARAIETEAIASEPEPLTPTEQMRLRRRRTLTIAAIALAVLVSVALTVMSVTSGAITAKVSNPAAKAGTRTYFTCKEAMSSTAVPRPYLAWAMGTTANTRTNQTDLSGNGQTGRYSTSATTDTSIGCLRDTPAASVVFAGNKCLYINANYSASTPNTFSLEAWFRTSNTSNGNIIVFGDRTGVADPNHDRKIYLDRDGRIVFGVYPNAVKIVYTAAGKNYADNAWHHVVATLSSAGQSLYVDGALAMTNPSVTTAQDFAGYWKVGCGALGGWRNAATDESGSTANDYSGPTYFTGQLQYAATYTVALTAEQVREHYLAGVD